MTALEEAAGRPQWRILETDFGIGLNFLSAWRAWRDLPARPRILHFVSARASPVLPADILQGVAERDDLRPVAQELVARWFGLTPGAHRLSFEEGRVLLTLHVRDVGDVLRTEPFTCDVVLLAHAPGEAMLKAVGRHCRRGTRLIAPALDPEASALLGANGFDVQHSRAVFNPRWTPRRAAAEATTPSRCIVIGSGLAGAAAAASLARRGWQVTVLDAGDVPAAGASGLPVGLLAPHTSPDDNLLSRLSRAGVRQTMQVARDLLVEGVDWQPGVTMEIHAAGERFTFPQGDGYEPWQRAASSSGGGPAVLHGLSAWVRPAALVRAWLSQDGIEWQGLSRVERIDKEEGGWAVVTAGGRVQRAALVVVAAALGCRGLAGLPLALNAVRGQIAWGFHDESPAASPNPLNGNGHYIPNVPCGSRRAWYCGSTYGRGDEDTSIRPEDTQANLERLSLLSPGAAAAARRHPDALHAWAGVRCTSSDRRPLVGALAPGLLVSTAMGSRGLTFCALAAELLAARLHAEPLPLEERLARSLDASRALRPAAQPGGFSSGD